VKKFDTLLSNYLYSNKTVDIEGLGTFSLDENFVLPPDAEKAAFYPLEGIHFTYSSRAETSPELLDYLVQQTGKIRSLISADFSSYVAEIRQFVNIGKAWVIEGIGTLQKTRNGNYELVPGEAMSERVNVHYVDEDEVTEKPVRRNRWIIGLLFTIAVVAVVAGLGFGVYVMFIKSQDNKDASQQTVSTLPDSTKAISSDSISRKPDSLNRRDSSAINISSDTSNNYKVIHEITKWRERATKRTSQLNQLGIKSTFDSMVMRDTLRYRLFVYKSIQPADTNKAKDSLSIFFGRKVRLEKVH
jgi:hypothetical protein